MNNKNGGFMNKNIIGKRIGAFVIDSILLFIFVFVASIVITSNFLAKEYIQVLPWMVISFFNYPLMYLLSVIYDLYLGTVDVITLYTFLAIFFSEVLYHFLFESSPLNASIGHKMTKCQVVNQEYKKLTFHQLLIRSIVKVLSRYLFCLPYITIFFTEKRQTMHDMAVKSMVIEKS